jgi:mono/diheme cytochrome c family protein
MVSRTRTLLAGSVIVWAAAIGLASTAAPLATAQKTTNDRVYSKAQADGAKASFNKLCADCHAFTVAAKKRPADLPLGDDPFLKKWNGRSLDELVTLIVMTMPNDGSAVVTDAEAIDMVAYILQQNGFPAGPAALTKSSASAVLAPPKK